MADGRVNRAALAVGLTGIVVILVLKRLWRAIPAVAVAVVVGIAAVAAFDLDQEGLKVIGVLPEGLPGFAFPAVDLADLGALFSGAVGIALVAVADTTVLSQSLAARRGDSVDPNQELRALGAANLAAGFFQGFAISSSASRTPVAVSAGARSQLTPLVGAVAIALLLVFAPGLRRDLLEELRAEGITLAFAELKGPVKDRLRRYGLFDAVGDDRSSPPSAPPSTATSGPPAPPGSTGRNASPR